MSTLSGWRRGALERLARAGLEEGEAQESCVRLLAELAKVSRLSQVTDPHQRLTLDQLEHINKALARREAREPLSQILGLWSFWGLDFKVTRDVLTPRADTEVLVEEALAWARRQSQAGPLFIVDVCAGTGCVGLSIASELSGRVLLIELCERAFGVLSENSARLAERGLTRATLELRRGDLLDPLALEERPDLIVSNPPYISSAELLELMPEVREHEPHLALDGGEDGLDLVRALTRASFERLRSGGALMMEVGWRQTDEVSQLFYDEGFRSLRVRRDYGGNPRLLIGERP